jgi:hypothetical protein
MTRQAGNPSHIAAQTSGALFGVIGWTRQQDEWTNEWFVDLYSVEMEGVKVFLDVF